MTGSVALGQIALPGTPGPTLTVVWEALSLSARAALLPHLLGPTSADWIQDTLRSEGYVLSASSIRTYRRSLKGV